MAVPVPAHLHDHGARATYEAVPLAACHAPDPPPFPQSECGVLLLLPPPAPLPFPGGCVSRTVLTGVIFAVARNDILRQKIPSQNELDVIGKLAYKLFTMIILDNRKSVPRIKEINGYVVTLRCVPLRGMAWCHPMCTCITYPLFWCDVFVCSALT